MFIETGRWLLLTRYWRDGVTLLSRDTKQILDTNTFEQSHTECPVET